MKLNFTKAFLFTPGDQEKMILKSLQRNDCAVIFDLEDSVIPSRKQTARDLLARLLPGEHALKVRLIRINSPETVDFTTDMKLVEMIRPSGIMFPKATGTSAKIVEEALYQIQSRTGWMVPVIPIIETAQGFEEINDVLNLLPSTPHAAFGGEDLATDLGIKRTAEGSEIEYARWRFIFSCRAHNVWPIDTVYVGLRDLEGLERETVHVRNMGMIAKGCIHPSHVEIINRSLTPSQEEVVAAKRIVEIASLPENQGNGSISIDGKMVDIPVVKRAEEVLSRAGIPRVLV